MFYSYRAEKEKQQTLCSSTKSIGKNPKIWSNVEVGTRVQNFWQYPHRKCPKHFNSHIMEIWVHLFGWFAKSLPWNLLLIWAPTLLRSQSKFNNFYQNLGIILRFHTYYTNNQIFSRKSVKLTLKKISKLLDWKYSFLWND